MKFVLQKNDVATKRSFYKISLFFGIVILSMIFVILAKNLTETSIVPSIMSAENGIGNTYVISSNSNSQTINQTLNLLIPSAVLTIITIIVLLILGTVTITQPKPLQEIITSDNFKINYSKETGSKDKAIIFLHGGSIEVTWNSSNGQFQNWKITLTMKIEESKDEGELRELAKLLLMEKESVDGLKYKKIALIRDWPKQDFLIQYWYQGLKL